MANGLGNFTSRVLTLQSQCPEIGFQKADKGINEKIQETKQMVIQKLEAFKFNESLAGIWDLIAFGDKYINQTEVWKIQNPNIKCQIILNLKTILDNIAIMLQPFLPETSAKISRLKKGEILFPRL